MRKKREGHCLSKASEVGDVDASMLPVSQRGGGTAGKPRGGDRAAGGGHVHAGLGPPCPWRRVGVITRE